MNFEANVSKVPSELSESAKLAQGFRELNGLDNDEQAVIFEHLEEDLAQNEFSLATATDLGDVFYNNSLLCRSETFSSVMDLILDGKPLVISGNEGDANMCLMAGGEGFKVAMTEGFSGKDVDAAVKVVMTFRSDHLKSRHPITLDKELWKTKPDTARVSLSGDGEITHDDIEMISFRFPVRFFPEKLLTETEQDQLEESGIKFIVRHYISNNKKTIH